MARSRIGRRHPQSRRCQIVGEAAQGRREGWGRWTEHAVQHLPALRGRAGSGRVRRGKPIQSRLEAVEGHFVRQFLDSDALREVLVVPDVLARQGDRGLPDAVHDALQDRVAPGITLGRLHDNNVVGATFPPGPSRSSATYALRVRDGTLPAPPRPLWSQLSASPRSSPLPSPTAGPSSQICCSDGSWPN